MSQSKDTYKTIIEEKGFYIATPVGTSMLPLLISREDTVKLVKPEVVKKYDVILYQRKNGDFVLHRVVKVKKDSYVLCGDNQFIKEYGITKDMIIGKMEGFYKKEEYIEATSKKYMKYSKRRVASIPFRKLKADIKKLIKKIIRKK